MYFEKKIPKYNLLYVDDEAVNLLTFEKDFGRDYNLFTAVNTKEGFKILKENEIHLVISDYMMPDVKGTEFLAKVRKNYPYPKLILISAYEDFSMLIKAVNDLGLFRFINKPYEPKEFRQVIKNALYNYQLEKDKKHSEKILRESLESLSEAQRIAHLGNWVWDIFGDTLKWSDEIYRIFGLKPKEFEATYEAFINYVHPDDREFLQQTVTDAVNNRTSYSCTHRIVNPDKTERIVYEKANVTLDDSGKVVRMVGTVQDITERKLVEAELAQYREHLEELVRKRTMELKLSETKNRALLDAIPDMIIRVKRDGTYLEVIPGKDMKTIFPVNKFIRKTIGDIIQDKTALYIMKTIELTLNTGEVQTAEYQFIISEEVHYREARFIGLGKDEVMIIERDVTERKKAEESLKHHSEELEKFNDIMIDREMRIIELKEEVNKLAVEADKEKPYPTDWEEDK